MKPFGRVLVPCLGILTALAGPAVAQDETGIRVLKSSVLPLMAGPANTAALLSLDGSRILHIGTDEVCTLGPADGQTWPAELLCVGKPTSPRLWSPDDMKWSPDGRHLLLPTFAQALQALEDTDITVLDAETLTQRVLTDDAVTGGILDHGPASLDIAARWVDADTVAFLRYPIGAAGWQRDVAAALMTIEVDGTGERTVVDLPQAQYLGAYTLTISADGGTAAYAIEDRNGPEAGGIWTVPLDGSTAPVRLVTSEAIGGNPIGLAFSADGAHLLALVPSGADGFMDARIVAVATGDVFEVDKTRNVGAAAWSPTGSALAYVTGRAIDGSAGLFVVDEPGTPGRLLLEGLYMPPVCCGREPFVWAADDTMLLGRVEDGGTSVELVRLGR